MVGVPVMDHCQSYDLVGNGVVHEGYWSTLLGLPGWPAAGEELIVARNILLAELCDHEIHCQHISAAGSVRLLREARARGVKSAVKSARITSRSPTSRFRTSTPISR
jgi:dihydroorotase